MDAVQAARSGHPGAPMGMADIAEVLWNRFLHHNPANPQWPDRDRFVLSNGHASMLLYALLHLSGYDLSLEELKNFRRLRSRTPGHPEHHDTPGVETTTGPLGQGLANAVGMALAEKNLAATFNREGLPIVDHHTYVFAGDGCLMEGISHEACSLAATLGLGKLIVFYDSNGISIDGKVDGWFTENVPERFSAYGWHVVPDVDGHDEADVQQAIVSARTQKSQPSLICCKTIIGFGSPEKQGTAACHGAPLGEKEITAARERLGWEHPPFVVPQEIYDGWNAHEAGAKAEALWRELFATYEKAFPELAAEFTRRVERRMPDDWEKQAQKLVHTSNSEVVNEATRKSSGRALEAFSNLLPELVGGSADLAESNNTTFAGTRPITKEEAAGNYIYFGVREFAMSAIASGMALHGGLIPYTATFLTFSDYARNAVRMAALMRLPVIFLYTHDSVGLGEDGPTHQPVEHLASLRLIPNLDVWRPSDAAETFCAWRGALERRTGPSVLALSRQSLPANALSETQLASISRGGYILRSCTAKPKLNIIATGSEVSLALAAWEHLKTHGYPAQVVSMPCLEVYGRQEASWQAKLLPDGVKRLILEAGVTALWQGYTRKGDIIVGVDDFGMSAPAEELFRHFGLYPERVCKLAMEMVTEHAD